MFLYFNAQNGKMIGFAKSFENVETSEFGDAESVVHRDNDKIVYWKPDWKPVLTSLEDGRTWVLNEAKYVVEEDTGWFEFVSEQEKLQERLKESREVVVKEGLVLLQNKIAEITDNVGIGYFTEMKRIGAKVAKGKANDNEKLLFEIQSNVLELGLDAKEAASKFNNEASFKLQKVNSVYTHHKKFLKDVEEATSIEDLKQYIHTLRNILTNTIPS